MTEHILDHILDSRGYLPIVEVVTSRSLHVFSTICMNWY